MFGSHSQVSSTVNHSAAWFLRKLPEIRRIIRPIYIELGILPGVAQEI